jgi:hypothetical protein
MLKPKTISLCEKFCTLYSVFELQRKYPRVAKALFKSCNDVKNVLDTALPLVKLTVYLDKSTQVGFKWCVKRKFLSTDMWLTQMDKINTYPESYRNDRFVLRRFNFLCDLYRVNRMQDISLDSYKFIVVQDLYSGEIYSNCTQVVPERHLRLLMACI